MRVVRSKGKLESGSTMLWCVWEKLTIGTEMGRRGGEEDRGMKTSFCTHNRFTENTHHALRSYTDNCVYTELTYLS